MNLISDPSQQQQRVVAYQWKKNAGVRGYCDWPGLGLTSGRGRGQQSVVDSQQEEQQDLPGLPHHGNGLSGQLLDSSQNLLAQPDVVQAVLFWSGWTDGRTHITLFIRKSQRDIFFLTIVTIAPVEIERTANEMIK